MVTNENETHSHLGYPVTSRGSLYKLSSFRGDNQFLGNEIEDASNKKMQVVSGRDNRIQEQEVL